MIIKKCEIEGAFIIEIERLEDERGFFARSWSKEELTTFGINTNLVHCNISYSFSKGTMHGLHYQIAPFQEEKLVRCTKGKIFDVMIDVRTNSPTYKKWIGFELTESNYKMLYVPKGCAHGFVTLDNDTEVFYQNTEMYVGTHERGIRWDDPALNIQWPVSPTKVSKKDSSWKYFDT